MKHRSLEVERACAPGLVLLLNLSLPNHGAWIKERLLALGYTEIWRGQVLLHSGRAHVITSYDMCLYMYTYTCIH